MNTYLINSFHIVTEDDFEHGEVIDSNFWDMKATTVQALTPKDAIAKYFESTLYLPFNIEFLEIQDDDCIRYYNLVDGCNQEPTDHEIELWRKGKKKLYSLDTTIEIYELNQITEI